MKDYVPKENEMHQIERYRQVLHKLVDATLLGKKIVGRYNYRFTRNKGKGLIIKEILIGGVSVWRATNASYERPSLIIDAEKARLDLREYFHIKDGVSIKALDYAETIDG